MSDNLKNFEADNPGFAEWWTNSTFPFAVSLREQVAKKGYLSYAQEAAARRCMERKPIDAASAPTVDTTKLEAAFAVANPRLRNPTLTVGAFRFSLAPVTGKNPGAIYVKKDGEYLGKMLGGKLLARCTEEAMTQVLGIAADPLGKAIEHGKLTGRCAVCNRSLKAEDSVGRGIGPICAEKFGW